MLKKIGSFLDEALDKTIVFSYTNVGYGLRKWRWDDDTVPMAGKVCVVTGANSGLGRVAAEQFAHMQATVHMICRNPERGKKAQQEIIAATQNDNVHLHLVDMSVQAQIRGFVDGFLPDQIDVLINNAGVLLQKRAISAENIEMTFATNVLGYFLLTELLLPKLKAAPSARVINVTSGGMYPARIHLSDLQYERRTYNGTAAYAESKRAEVIMTERWVQEWADTQIAVHVMHPGWAATPGVANSLPQFDKLMQPFLRSAEQGADTIVWLATTPDLKNYNNGELWFDRQIRPKHKMGVKQNSAEQIEQFWEILHAMTGLSI